jgi:hypothetical protein
VLQAAEVVRVPFTTVHRQTDRTFVEHLTRIRHGERISEAIEAINIACCRPHRAGRTAVVLAPTNARVDAYNYAGLAALRTPEHVYRGETKGEFDLVNDRLPAPESLALKFGARVMAVRNDVARRWINGSVGSVTRLADDQARVRLDAGDEVEIERASWERIRYAWNDTEGRVEATVIGSYTQLRSRMGLDRTQGSGIDSRRRTHRLRQRRIRAGTILCCAFPGALARWPLTRSPAAGNRCPGRPARRGFHGRVRER